MALSCLVNDVIIVVQIAYIFLFVYIFCVSIIIIMELLLFVAHVECKKIVILMKRPHAILECSEQERGNGYSTLSLCLHLHFLSFTANEREYILLHEVYS